ncbi:MAG: hypothetical protein ABRQ24_11265 [Syntrophomonadaceae bacterium]
MKPLAGPQQGTTLVEVLAALALGSLLVTSLVTFYDSAARGYVGLAAVADCQYTARTAMEQIKSDIRSAATVQVSADGSVLELTSADREIRFYAQNAALYRRLSTERGTTAVPIAENVSDVAFGRQGELVVVTLSIGRGSCFRTLTTAVNTRL